MGEEYPSTFVVGELTAPNSAPSHSCFRVSTVFWGSAMPVSWKVVKPAGREVKVNEREGLEMASRMRRPACCGQNWGLGWEVQGGVQRLTGITSRPMPSPGISPMRRARAAIDEQRSVLWT